MRLVAHQTRKMPLRQIRKSVSLFERLHAKSRHGGNVVTKTIGAWLIEADRRPDPRPGPIKHRGHSVMENIEESPQRVITMIAHSLAHILGNMNRHRPLWPKHPEETLDETRPL